MSRANPTPIRTLSARNLDVLYNIARFKFLTTEQIRALHFRHVGPESEAPRMLLYRLRKQGLVERQLSFARSTQASDGLTVTKPRPVWMMPQSCLTTLRKHLARVGNLSAADRFGRWPQSNHARSFSEQGLAHEIGISSLLIGFEHAQGVKPGLRKLKWLRTSPRHVATSLSLTYRVGGRVMKGHINPDAAVYLTMQHAGRKYPFLFFLEFERGTAPPAEFVRHKLTAYAALANQMRVEHDNYCLLLKRINAEMVLGLVQPHALPFRVLTVTRSGREAADLMSAAAVLNEPKLFNFSALGSVSEDALGAVWLRPHEFTAETGRGGSWQKWYLAESERGSRVELLDQLWEGVGRVALP